MIIKETKNEQRKNIPNAHGIRDGVCAPHRCLCKCRDSRSKSRGQHFILKCAQEETLPVSGTRDNTPVVLVPSADGTVTYGNPLATIDASHADEGYIMAKYTGSKDMAKLLITAPGLKSHINILSAPVILKFFP